MSLKIRPLEGTDYNKGYIELLNQLSPTSKDRILQKDFEEWAEIIATHNLHYTFVLENDDQIVGTATLFIEPKLLRNFSFVGHIEDVVVNERYRQNGIGKGLINHLTEIAKVKGCYKVILDCSQENVGFYGKCGYEKHGIEMSTYFDDMFG